MRLAALAAAMAMAACGGAPGEPEQPGALASAVPAEAADIIGTVTQLERAGGETRILVEQEPTRSAGHPKAYVRVTSRTRMLARTGGGSPARASVADLAQGARVQVWFTGPVAESYPVQAVAGTVLVER